jgi:hypothetical protein
LTSKHSSQGLKLCCAIEKRERQTERGAEPLGEGVALCVVELELALQVARP